MEVIQDITSLRSAIRNLPRPIGFVPTMGYLHEGHISLARAARRDCAAVVASIYVNPSQFGPNEDLAKYPRNLERDLELLSAVPVDLVWTPDNQIMYPADYQNWVEVEQVAAPLEGSMRPGHFRGVATVVAKLFNCVQPDKAYFGQKDAQQVRVIQQMIRDLNFPIEMVVCPTARESDGLAMSSRNVYLSPEERQAAPVIHRALRAAEARFLAGERDAALLRRQIEAEISAEPLAKVQYVSISDARTLQEMERIQADALISLAVYFGKTRLIDNLILRTAG